MIPKLLRPGLLGMSLAIIEKNNQTLIIREHGQFGWTLPGGKARKGENPRETLLRELKRQFTDLQLVEPLVILRHFENPRPTTFFLMQIDGIMTPDQKKIADAQWVDPIVDHLEYELPCQTIRLIISFRIKRAQLEHRLSTPPPILD